MSTRIILIRHGETEWNKNHRYLGRTDIPLNAIGKKQSQRLKERLASAAIDAVYVSPAKRAQQTANIIFSSKNIPLITHDSLQELNFGKWEGLTSEEIQLKYPQELTRWEKNPLIHAPPDGEAMTNVRDRLQTLFKRVQKNHHGQTIVFVGHGGAFSIFICMLLGVAPNATWQFRLSPASVSKMHMYAENIVLTLLNDTSHLK